ncbi:MAG: class I SAM-dependent methyltransferase [Actinomycetota bacterium]|nr:class I SAM-dependent methyltransferase [Actinomycetota bacterium]
MNPVPAPTAEDPGQQLYRLGEVLQVASAFDAAARLGILDHLEQTPACADEVAQHCATAPAATHLLLDALDALGLLRRGHDGRYATTAAAAWFTTLAAGWSRLDQVVRTGQPLVPADTPAGAAELYPEVVPVLSRLFAPAVQRAAELLAPVRGEVLDVGAGAAPWSIALAAADPTAQVTALDLPEVLRTTRRTVEAAGLGTRFEFRAGDMFTAELPQAAYDVIILGNVCHLFSPDANRTLLQRLRSALRDGGTLAIVDALPSEDPEERRSLSLYSLGLRMRTSAGAVHPLDAYATWIQEARYGAVRAISLSRRPPLALLTCTAGISEPAHRL